jgi:hypothetical protein
LTDEGSLDVCVKTNQISMQHTAEAHKMALKPHLNGQKMDGNSVKIREQIFGFSVYHKVRLFK